MILLLLCLAYFHSVWHSLGPSMLLQIALFHSCLWLILHCIYAPHLLYLFLCWWTFRLFPCLGYCKQSCNEYWGVWLFSDNVFLWIYAQSGIAWSYGWVMVWSSDKTWSIGKENGKSLQYSCFGTPWTGWNGKKIRHWEMSPWGQ